MEIGLVPSRPRVQSLVRAYHDRFGCGPQYVARNPGRVNLIGEHIDYMGFSVLPMAIEADCMVCVGPADTGIRVEHMDGDRMQGASVDHLAEGGKTIDIDPNQHKWTNYALAGIKGVLEELGPTALPKGLAFLVEGNVPMSAGLSSSSALVCAAASATAAALGAVHLTKSQLAEVCRKCEQHVGTMGGGMDQAVSFLAQAGVAQRIHFDPLKACPVPLPDDAVFVVSNSLVEASKAVTAHTGYNKRVVECRLACAVVAVSILSSRPDAMAEFVESRPRHTVRQLMSLQHPSRDLGKATSGPDLTKRLKMSDTVALQVEGEFGVGLEEFTPLALRALRKTPYSLNDVSVALELPVEEVEKVYLHVNGRKVQGPFLLYDRMRHVLEESFRVATFEQLCKEPAVGDPADRLRQLGALMNRSHESCRDLYDCSTPDLDRLTGLCREMGAYGSRLTGAGWGGCAVSLVSRPRCEAFMDSVWEGFYKDKEVGVQRSQVLFATSAAAGSAVWRTKAAG